MVCLVLASIFLLFLPVKCNKVTFVEFLVSGKVNGVRFREYAEMAAEKFRVRGYIVNTGHAGLLVGMLEGRESDVIKMKHWLLTEGSPDSKINAVIFRGEKKLPHHQFTKFTIRRFEMMGDDALKTWEYEIKTRNITGTKSPCGHLANRTFTDFSKILTYKPLKLIPQPPIHVKRILRLRQKLKKIQTTALYPETD